MKKLLCIVLTVCLLCPLLSGCAGQDPETKMKKAYLRELYIKDKEPSDVVIDYDGGEYDGARVVMLDACKHEPQEETVALINDTTITYYDANRLYVYKYGFLFSLESALERKIISEEDLLDIAANYNASVSSFLDVCDKHDFEIGKADLSAYDADNVHIRPDAVMIKFDKKILVGGKVEEKQLTIDYINSVLGEELVEEIGFHVFEDSETIFRKVFINNDDIEKLPEVMNALAAVPGVLTVSCYNRLIYPGI